MDALDPGVLTCILEKSVLRHLDTGKYNASLERAEGQDKFSSNLPKSMKKPHPILERPAKRKK